MNRTLLESEKFLHLSPGQRTLYLHLYVCFADDEGRMERDDEKFKRLVFPYDLRLKPAHIATDLHVLEGKGLLSLYSVDGADYIALTGFSQEQDIPRRFSGKSKLPPPPSEFVLELKSPALSPADNGATTASDRPPANQSHYQHYTTNLASLEELEGTLYDDCLAAWTKYKRAASNKNKSGKVSTLVMAKHLTAFLDAKADGELFCKAMDIVVGKADMFGNAEHMRAYVLGIFRKEKERE